MGEQQNFGINLECNDTFIYPETLPSMNILQFNLLSFQFVSLGEQQNFGIKTAGLEDKATACQMLVCYARELKEHFVEYTEQTVSKINPSSPVLYKFENMTL